MLGGSNCVVFNNNSCSVSNWLKSKKEGYWLITTPPMITGGAWCAWEDGRIFEETISSLYVRPSVYLNADITITGTGENIAEGIYKIS